MQLVRALAQLPPPLHPGPHPGGGDGERECPFLPQFLLGDISIP